VTGGIDDALQRAQHAAVRPVSLAWRIAESAFMN
jgi:hypothetical protein